MRRSASTLHKQAKWSSGAPKQEEGVRAVITENWDGSKNVLTTTGRANVIDVQHAPKPAPGEHFWVTVISYAVDIDAFDARDPDDPASGLGALGPDKVVGATPPICSECATVYTPEERNTVCSGVVPDG